MERKCWYCDKPLSLTKLFKRDLFCSSEHETLYFSEQSAVAFERIKEQEPPKAPAADEVKPPEPMAVEQAPDNEGPPMAGLLKSEVFPCEAPTFSFAPEDAVETPAEPARPYSPYWQIKPELAPAGRIYEDPASPSAMADPQGEFPQVQFTESTRNLAQMRSAVEPAGVNPLESAQCVPVWNGRAAGETAANVISMETSIPAPFAPRIVPGPTNLHTHLSSTAAACSWVLRSAASATSARLVFVSSPAFRTREMHSAAGAWTPNPPQPAPRGTLTEGWNTPRTDVDGRPAFDAHFEEPGVNFLKSKTLAGVEAPSIRRSARVHGSWETIRPLEPEQVSAAPAVWTNQPNLTGTIQPLSGERGACRPAVANFREIQTGAVDWRGTDSIASAELTSTGVLAIPRTQFRLPSFLPLAWRTQGAWRKVRPVASEPSPRIATVWMNGYHPALAVRPIGGTGRGCRPVTANFREIPSAAVDWHATSSITPSSEGTSTGSIAIPPARQHIPSYLPSAGLDGSWLTARPVESRPESRLAAAWTSQHNPPVTIPRVGDPGSARRLSIADRREILPRVFDCRAIDPVTPYAWRTPIRAAGFAPVSGGGVPAGNTAVKFAVPTGLQRGISDSSVAAVAQARWLEPTPASMVAEPRTLRRVAAVLLPGSRIDPQSEAVSAGACSSVLPCLDRQTDLPRRIPQSVSVPAVSNSMTRSGPAPAAVFALHHDSAAESRVTPAPPVRIQPASIFAPPSPPATIAIGWTRDRLTPGHAEFLANRCSVTTQIPGVVLHTSATPALTDPIQPARASVQMGRTPRPAACFALHLSLQTVDYQRGRKIRL